MSRTATRFCYHCSKININLPSVVEIETQNTYKNQSHISACKQWHKQPYACKQRHRKFNRVLTCVTLKIKTFRPIKRCHVSWKKSLKNPSIRLWHVSPIKLRHVSLTYPQTPINRSLPKAFPKKTPTHQEILEQTKTSKAQATLEKI